MFIQLLIIMILFTGTMYFFNLFLNRENKFYSISLSKFSKFFSSMFPTLLFIFVIRSFIFEPFQISSESMMPTLLSGDFILVNKFLYGIRNPISQKKIFDIQSPKRGDILVFKYPLNPSINYIKRIIGIPGDKIIYNSYNQRLFIYPNYKNNQNFQKNIIPHIPIIYKKVISNSNENESFMKKRFFSQLKTIEKKSNKEKLIEYQEFFGKKSHRIFLLKNDIKILDVNSEEFNFSQKEWIVPKGKYFVMGDNRNNSFDSRYWGFISDAHLIGKAVGIWMSIEKSKNFFPIKFRLERIGKIY